MVDYFCVVPKKHIYFLICYSCYKICVNCLHCLANLDSKGREDRIWLKNYAISDFEGTFFGFANFERSADHGFLHYFSVNYGFCLF